MSDDKITQYALEANMNTLLDAFTQVATQDDERQRLTSGLLQRLHAAEEQVKELQMDLKVQNKSRADYQREAMRLQEQHYSIEQQLKKDSYVVVLIDGDGSKFLDVYLQNPEEGAAHAAQVLRKEVKDYLRNTSLGLTDVPVLVRVYANLNGLANSLRLSSVIDSDSDMRIFAEQFTNSRSEFDFINVGRGKENADSKMRKMFNHFWKNIQCKKIFFAGCHDNGYLHDLREHVGDPQAKERIVLVETTTAEPGFLNLGFPMIRLDNVFRSEPLRNETKFKPLVSRTRKTSDSLEVVTPPLTSSPSPAPSASQPLTAQATAVSASPSTNITASGNGGVSIKYPPSYATAGGASGHQNVVVDTGKPKKIGRTIDYNINGHRLDPPIKNPGGYENPAQKSYKVKLEKIQPSSFCNNHYLNGKCFKGDKCNREHGVKLTPDETKIHRYRARTSVCPSGPGCEDFNCPLSHHCMQDPYCTRGDCRFSDTKKGDLHLTKEEMQPKTRYTEGVDEPVELY